MLFRIEAENRALVGLRAEDGYIRVLGSWYCCRNNGFSGLSFLEQSRKKKRFFQQHFAFYSSISHIDTTRKHMVFCVILLYSISSDDACIIVFFYEETQQSSGEVTQLKISRQ